VAQHSDETKAAVLAALLTGQSIGAVAREYHLPKGTVSGWKRQSGMTPQPVATQKSAELGDLVVAYLTEVLTTVRAQAEQFRNTAWLAQQTAADAAVLHGVLVDKAVRLLEALAPSDDAG
jgi:transposase-like protein